MTIHELYDQIYPTKGMKNPGELINFYDDPNCNLTEQTFVDLYELERHNIHIELFNEDKEIHYKSMHIHIDYEFLDYEFKKYRANRAALNRIIELLEVYPGFKNKDIFKNPYYIKLRFNRAVENGYLGHINKAQKEFKKIGRKCPEYTHSCNKMISQYPDTADKLMDYAINFSFITGAMFILSFTVIFIKDSPSSGVSTIGVFSIPLMLIVVTSLLVIISKVLKARKKREEMD